MFDMGLSRVKLNRLSQHKLWLTIALENIPQMAISSAYAQTLSGFDGTAICALVSSIVSAMVSIYRVIIICKTEYYAYQVMIQLENPPIDQNTLKSDLPHIYNHPRLFGRAVRRGLRCLATDARIIVDVVLHAN